jgi:UDP-glucose 4-epimerase
MKLAITGALGHIGSRFIHELRAEHGHDVLLIDDLSTQRYCSLFELPKGVHFKFVEADIMKADLAKLFAGRDCVIHLAAITNAAASFDIQQEVERVNLVGTERVAQACLETGARMLFPSTTSVYGTQAEVVDESCTIDELKPQSPYADSKLKAERLLQDLAATRGLRTVICRFGTIFGIAKGMRFHTAVNKFIWQACHGQPITVWRTALHQRRPYLAIDDAVSAIRFILERDVFDGNIYNVLTINATVDEIVQSIRRYVADLEVQFVDSKIMNQLSYTVADERFRNLGFTPRGELDSGIRETVRLLRNDLV